MTPQLHQDVARSFAELSAPRGEAPPIHPASESDIIDLTRYHHRDSADLFAKVDDFIAHIDGVGDRGFYLWRDRLGSPSDRQSQVLGPDRAPQPMILLSSNNYLGLTTHPRVVAAHCDAAARYGTGSGSAPFFSGTYLPHRQLEVSLARWKGAEDCCLFSSGYAANVGVISALMRESDTIYLDRLVHASIHDGARMSGARVRVFRHSDPHSLEQRLRQGGGGKLVIVDAVYSMDGDIAPLPALLEVTRRHGATLLVDQAHATGVLGPTGRGIGEHFGLQDQDLLCVGTLSKALASVGGYFVGPRKVVEYVRHYARSAMFSTALPPSAPATAQAALEVLQEEPSRVAAVQAGGRYLAQRLREAGLPVAPTASPIIPVIVGDQPRLLTLARALHGLGIHVNCVFYPAVARRECRLRFSVMANHTSDDLDRAARATAAVWQRCPPSALPQPAVCNPAAAT